MKIWKDEEVKNLFQEVESCKKNNMALREAFSSHAEKFKRKPNSVRNYYYYEVDNLSNDKERLDRLKINLDLHQKSHFDSFEKIQEEELFEKIEQKVKLGQSVRSACHSLSGGDLSLMTRYQNKFQNMKRKIEEKDNIIEFKQQKLTDADINSLFLGLVRLIKKSARDEFKPNQLLRKAFYDLSKKDKEITLLKQEFEKLKRENSQLLSRLEQTKKEKLERHLNQNRQQLSDAKRI